MNAGTREDQARTSVVTAFFLMHGAVHPTKINDRCFHYSLTGKNLPHRTVLYAPKILGKSYHATDIIRFVSGLKNGWYQKNDSRLSFSEFCFSKILLNESSQVSQMKQEIEDRDFLEIMESDTNKPGKIKERRVFLESAIVQKSQIKWDRHQCFISEKSYYVFGRDPTNCIMFFCDITPEYALEQHHTITLSIILSNGNQNTVHVSYDIVTTLFKITFHRSQQNIFSFEELNQIVQNVVRHFNGNLDFDLALFDFTCCVTLFKDEHCLSGLTPELLSSVMLSDSDRIPKLIYGTVSEDRRREIESALRRGMTATYDPESFSQKELLSPPPSPARPSPPSPSPARANPNLVVNLLQGVESFADFEPISRFSSRSRSVSPNTRTTPPGPEEVDGGSRRRHRHVGNKVFRKQITCRYHRRNRDTKVHSKRRKRQRSNTKFKTLKNTHIPIRES